ncbi:hypothetical protein AHAS_Ahas04G0157200 [Arachis hypogaea]
MEANVAASLQAVQRLAQLTGSGNKNGEGADDSLRGVPRILAAFQKDGPPVFNGSTNHIEADNWFQAVERALLTQHVRYDQFVKHAAYQLVGEVQQWWQRERRLLHQQNVNITWALFEGAFYKKYFLESLREAKELELLQLKQGSMTIAEYTSKFEELCRAEGSVRLVMSPLEIRRFSELVDKARVVEEYAKTVSSSRNTLGGNTSRELDNYLGPREQNFKKDGHTPQHLQGQGKFRRGNKSQFHQEEGNGRCYNCGKPGHISKHYHRGSNQDKAQNQQSGRVCTVDARDTTGSDPPTSGKSVL